MDGGTSKSNHTTSPLVRRRKARCGEEATGTSWREREGDMGSLVRLRKEGMGNIWERGISEKEGSLDQS